MARPAQSRNRRTVIALSAILLAMAGLTVAAVPLYRLFCQVTGYGGTTRVATTAPAQVLERVITVRFNADVNSALPWTFRPAQGQMTLKVGETGLAFYEARNNADTPLTGTATFNVTPQKAGRYFNKIDCFCFTEQRLEPGEHAELAVTFFVDPAIADDPGLDEVNTITLSYTFFLAPSGFPAPSGEEGEPRGQAGHETAAAVTVN